MAISWDTVDFRGALNIRALPDIRRGMLFPYTLISQYDNSPRLRALLLGLERAVDPWLAIQEFYRSVFDPRSAGSWA